jgi:hypothetical protein
MLAHSLENYHRRLISGQVSLIHQVEGVSRATLCLDRRVIIMPRRRQKARGQNIVCEAQRNAG